MARILPRTAADTPCPPQEPFHYPFETAGDFTATCAGSPEFNGFYGDGIVDAVAAIRGHRPPPAGS